MGIDVEEDSSLGAMHLPEDALIQILSFCDDSALCLMSSTNRLMRMLSGTATLWRQVYLSKYKQIGHGDVKEVLYDNWKFIHVKRELLERNWRRGNAIELELEGHEKPVVCLDLNKTTVCSGSHDRTIRVWETDSGKCRHKLQGHSSWIRCIQSDDLKAVSGSSDRDIRIWNLNTGQCMETCSGHDGSVWCLRYNDTILASGAADDTVRVWDLGTGAHLLRLQGHTGPPMCLRLLDHHTVASGGMDGSVRLWDLRADQQGVGGMHGHSRRVKELFDVGGHTLVSFSEVDEEIRLWDVRTQRCLRTIEADGLNAISVSEDRIASGHLDATVRLWDMGTGTLQRTLVGHNGAVECLQFDRHKLVSGARDGSLRIWDPTSGRPLNRFTPVSSLGYPRCLMFNNNTLAYATSQSAIVVYDFKSESYDNQ